MNDGQAQHAEFTYQSSYLSSANDCNCTQAIAIQRQTNLL